MLVVGSDPSRTDAFVKKLRKFGLPAKAAAAEAAVRAADISVTATTATAPLFRAAWVQPGTHVFSMGSDAKGQQELPADLFPRACLFCHWPDQSVRIGEFQLANPEATPIAIGVVLSGDAPSRRDESEITVFESSGISLQDLYMARSHSQSKGCKCCQGIGRGRLGYSAAGARGPGPVWDKSNGSFAHS